MQEGKANFIYVQVYKKRCQMDGNSPSVYVQESQGICYPYKQMQNNWEVSKTIYTSKRNRWEPPSIHRRSIHRESLSMCRGILDSVSLSLSSRQTRGERDVEQKGNLHLYTDQEQMTIFHLCVHTYIHVQCKLWRFLSRYRRKRHRES